MDWRLAYQQLAETLPGLGQAARPIASLTSSCVDIVTDLGEVSEIAPENPRAVHLLDLLAERIGKGIGGEVVIDWPEGPAWVRENLPHSLSWGGTGPHVAMALTALGAANVTALTDRSQSMLSVLPDLIPLASASGIQSAWQVPRLDGKRYEVCVFEYTAGRLALGKIVPTRSSRIIVRFGDLGIEDDADFNRLTTQPDFEIGAGLIAGFQCVPQQDLYREYRRLAAIAGAWRNNGASIVHLELAGFPSPARVHDTLAALSGNITSVGMSESEFRNYFNPTSDPQDMADAMIAAARQFDLPRLCVHADHWMASVTQGDPEEERRALMLGGLLAATRAASGSAQRPEGIPAGAQIVETSFGQPSGGGDYKLVVVPTLYLADPRTTLGMGDTFTAGCLLAFAEAASAITESIITVDRRHTI